MTLDKDAPAGYLQDHLLLVTSEGQSIQMPLAVEGRVVSNLTVSPSSLFMGVVQPGQEVTKSLVVKGTRPFKVLSIACEDKAFKFAATGDEAKTGPRDSRDLCGRQHRGKGDQNDSDCDRPGPGIARTLGLRGDFLANGGQREVVFPNREIVLFLGAVSGIVRPLVCRG